MHPDRLTSLYISDKYSDFLTDVTTENKELQDLKNGKVYEFDVYHRLAGPEKPRILYWHEDYGVIKYITHGGITWERINLVEDE